VRVVPATQEDLTGLAPAIAIDIGYALLKDGGVMSWDTSRRPWRIPGIDNAIGVGKGVVLRNDGTLTMIGSKGKRFGQLRGVTDVSFGHDISCAAMKSGQVRCAPSDNSAHPMVVRGLRSAKEVSVGGNSACALTRAGQVWCWTHGTPRSAAHAKRVADIDGATELHVTHSIGCARWPDGRVRCFKPQPAAPSLEAEKADAIAVTDFWRDGDAYPVLCRATGKQVRCDHAGLNGSELTTSPKLEAESKTRVSALAADHDVLCTLDEHGHVRCMGQNHHGLLGHPQAGVVDQPMRIDGIPPLESLTADQDWACGISNADEGWCWTVGGEPNRIDLDGPVARVMGNFNHMCMLNAKSEATCFEASAAGIRKPTRAPALDGARAATFPDPNGYSNVVGVITAQGQLATGQVPTDGSMKKVTLTVMPAISKATSVTRTPVHIKPGVGSSYEILTLTADNDVYAVGMFNDKAKAARKLPMLRQSVALGGYGLTLKSDGTLRDRQGKLLRKTTLSKLVGGAACGTTAARDLMCVELNPALVDHPYDRVIMRNVRAAATGDSAFALFMLDAKGRLHCHGSCGGKGGVDKSDTLLLVPLRDQPK